MTRWTAAAGRDMDLLADWDCWRQPIRRGDDYLRLVRRVGQHPQVAAPAAVRLGPGGRRRHQRATVRAGDRIGETGRDTADRSLAALADRLGQRDQIVLVRMASAAGRRGGPAPSRGAR